MTDARPTIPVDGLRTYLHCPRRYEFEHVFGLEGSEDSPAARRLSVCRRAICDGLRASVGTGSDLEETACARLEERFDDLDERFHSMAQRRHERRVLEATVRTYCEEFGTDHADGIAQLRAEAAEDGELIGPELPLSATVSLPDEEVTVSPSDEEVTVSPPDEEVIVEVDAPIDYLFREGSAITAVRFVPTLRPFGLLRYRSAWDGDVAACFTDHFDPEDDRFEPAVCGALLETAAVLDGVRTLRDRLGLDDGVCRYLVISLADRSSVTVNWIRERVETSLEAVDLTEVFLDHHTFGLTHEHRNRTVERELAAVVAAIVGERFDPAPREPRGVRPRWEQIAAHSCGECAYAVCCQERLSSEVAFDG